MTGTTRAPSEAASTGPAGEAAESAPGAAPGEAETAEVVVVGAGPAGLMLACELALAGIDTVLLEALTERVQQVKGGAIQPRTAELLEARGLLRPMLRHAVDRAPVGGHFAMLPVPLDCTPWQTAHPCPLSVPQWAIEEVLEARAVELGVRIRRGAPVTALTQDEGQRVTITAGTGRFSAPWAVACDGAHSTVRRLLDLPFPGRAGTYRAVLTDVRLSAVSDLVPRKAGHISEMTHQANGYWAMLIPQGGDRYRLTFGGAEQLESPREAPVTDAEIATALRAVYGEETVLGAIDNRSRFGDATRQLESYRSGRVLFVGDAAHIHPPLGGQGLNLGVQDAFNLGWKLAATLRHRAPDGLLDSYHAERHPAAAQVLHHTAAQRVLADPRPSEDVTALRDIVTDLLRLPDANHHLAGLMSGLALTYDLPGDHPLIGHRYPGNPELTTTEATFPLSALFTKARPVLLDLTGTLPTDLPLPDHVDLIHAKTPDPTPATALLFRPDTVLSWATNAPTPNPQEIHHHLTHLTT